MHEDWAANLCSKPQDRVRETVMGSGICKKHTGGLFLYAAVRIGVEPAEEFEVIFSLPQEKRIRLESEGWHKDLVFGVLDVFMTKPMTPIGAFRLKIMDVEFDDIETRSVAVRLAARYAAAECLKQLPFVVV